MKILLSFSKAHFTPEDGIKIHHSAGILAELFYKAVKDLGDITYTDWKEEIKGGQFDLLIGQPRNFNFLINNNEIKKKIAFLNIAESSYTKRVLREEANFLGCKVSDCFAPDYYYYADHYFLIGNDFVKEQYVKAGIKDKDITKLSYSMGFSQRNTLRINGKPRFLHLATTLGLRKGFWRAIQAFRALNLDAELWCVGKVQNERFWIEFAKEAAEDERIKIIGWIDNNDPRYLETIYKCDYILYPSLSEGMPGTVIEAVEAGLIPLVSEASGYDYNGDYDNDKFISIVRRKVEGNLRG